MQKNILATVIVIFTMLLLANNVFSSTQPLKLKTPGVISVISYGEFKPVSFGDGQGYEGDILRAIAKLWHVKIRFYPEKIYEGLWRLPSRAYTRADVAMGGFTPAEYRIKEASAFSIMTAHFSQSLLVRKKDYQSGRITSYQSFKNTSMKIGVVPATTGEKYAYLRAKEAGLPSSVIIKYVSEAELLPALMSGKIDAIARGDIGNEYQALNHHELITIAKKNFGEGFAFAVDMTNPELIARLNQAINVVTDGGKITYVDWLGNHDVFLERVTSPDNVHMKPDSTSHK